MKKHTLKLGLFAALFAGLVLAVGGSACGPAGFAPQQELGAVRILATRADKPFTKPGDDVTLEMLAVDARRIKKQPLKIYWLPFVCQNPYRDLYYACFASALGGDGGAGEGGGGDGGGGGFGFPANLDLTPFLKEGSKYSFKVPTDIIDKHPPVQGALDRYGLSIVFAVACAGRVRTLAIDPSDPTPQKVPIGCFDDDGNQLGADDFVFSFARVYTYDNRPNANPPLDGVTFDGKDVDLAQGVVVDHCDEPTNCKHPVDVKVPDSAWELNPGAFDANGNALHEQVYAIYYYTLKRTEKEGKLLYDARTGKVADSANQFIPEQTGEGRLYVVVHDTRGGTTWADFPIYVK